MTREDPLVAWRMRRAEALRSAAQRVAPKEPVDVSWNEFEGFLQRHPLVMVDFWAAWCGPCRAMAPMVEELAREWKGRIAVAKVDTDAHPAIAQRFRVSGIPTFLFFRSGRVVGRLVGMQSKAAFDQVVREMEADAAADPSG